MLLAYARDGPGPIATWLGRDGCKMVSFWSANRGDELSEVQFDPDARHRAMLDNPMTFACYAKSVQFWAIPPNMRM